MSSETTIRLNTKTINMILKLRNLRRPLTNILKIESGYMYWSDGQTGIKESVIVLGNTEQMLFLDLCKIAGQLEYLTAGKNSTFTVDYAKVGSDCFSPMANALFDKTETTCLSIPFQALKNSIKLAESASKKAPVSIDFYVPTETKKWNKNIIPASTRNENFELVIVRNTEQ